MFLAPSSFPASSVEIPQQQHAPSQYQISFQGALGHSQPDIGTTSSILPSSVEIPQQQHAAFQHQISFQGAPGYSQHVTQGSSRLEVGQGYRWERTSHTASQPTQQVGSRNTNSFAGYPAYHPNEPPRGLGLHLHESSHDPSSTNGPYAPLNNRGAPAPQYAPSAVNNTDTSNVNPDDTHRAGAYELTGNYGEWRTASSTQQGGSSGVNQDVGEDHIAASTFLQYLSPGIVPTVEQTSYILAKGRGVVSW